MRNKTLVALFTIMIFLGQSISATNHSCSMEAVSDTQIENMDHSGHEMSSDMSNCVIDCSCSMATCTTVILVSNAIVDINYSPSQDISSELSFTLSKPTTSLFRPPITR